MKKIRGVILRIIVSAKQIEIDVSVDKNAEVVSPLRGYRGGRYQAIIFNRQCSFKHNAFLAEFEDEILRCKNAVGVQNALRTEENRNDGVLCGEFCIARAHYNDYGKFVYELSSSDSEYPYSLWLENKGDIKPQTLPMKEFGNNEFVKSEKADDESVEELNSEEAF